MDTKVLSSRIPSADIVQLENNLQKLQVTPESDCCRRLQNLSEDDLIDMFTHQDDDGDTALMSAIIDGRSAAAIATSLIRLVPSPNLLDVQNKLGQTALHLTVITGQWRLTRELVLAGANLQCINFKGDTPLHIACDNNNIDCIVSLTKLVTCLECPEKQKRQSLIVPQHSELYNFNGQTCLHVAVQTGYASLVKYLIETQFRADVNSRERLCGKTAFHIAAENGNTELVEYLLSIDQMNPDVLTYAGHSVVDLAMGRGQKGVLDMLEKGGVIAMMKNRTMSVHEDREDMEGEDSDYEDEYDQLTIEDFQCSLTRNSNIRVPVMYDDLCVGGISLQALTRVIMV